MLDNEQVAHDLDNPEHPQTAFGYVAEGLRRRKAVGNGPITILSCDNLQHNGNTARKAFMTFVEHQDKELAAWMKENVTFPNSMVDRITPATRPDDIERLNRQNGTSDEAPVYCEDFIQWVIEDNFIAGRPAWEKVGAEFTDDVTAYENMKLSLLNASHTLLSYPSFLSGYRKVDDAMQRLDKTTEGVKNQLSAEFAPYLESATEKWTDLIAGTGKALKDSGLIDGFGMLLDTFAGIIQPTDTLSGKSLPALTQALRPVAELMAGIASTIELIASIVDIKSLFTKPGEYFKRIYTASGLGYNQGYKNQIQQLQDKYTQMGTNAATDANGYGEYYYNGTYYANRDAALYAQFSASGYSGTFEAWKVANGYNASGNHNWRGGVTWVGENGPELVSLPRGSQIMTAQESREVGPTNFYITIDAKNVREFNDIVEIAKNARMNARKIHA